MPPQVLGSLSARASTGPRPRDRRGSGTDKDCAGKTWRAALCRIQGCLAEACAGFAEQEPPPAHQAAAVCQVQALSRARCREDGEEEALWLQELGLVERQLWSSLGLVEEQRARVQSPAVEEPLDQWLRDPREQQQRPADWEARSAKVASPGSLGARLRRPPPAADERGAVLLPGQPAAAAPTAAAAQRHQALVKADHEWRGRLVEVEALLQAVCQDGLRGSPELLRRQAAELRSRADRQAAALACRNAELEAVLCGLQWGGGRYGSEEAEEALHWKAATGEGELRLVLEGFSGALEQLAVAQESSREAASLAAACRELAAEVARLRSTQRPGCAGNSAQEGSRPLADGAGAGSGVVLRGETGPDRRGWCKGCPVVAQAREDFEYVRDSLKLSVTGSSRCLQLRSALDEAPQGPLQVELTVAQEDLRSTVDELRWWHAMAELRRANECELARKVAQCSEVLSEREAQVEALVRCSRGGTCSGPCGGPRGGGQRPAWDEEPWPSGSPAEGAGDAGLQARAPRPHKASHRGGGGSGAVGALSGAGWPCATAEVGRCIDRSAPGTEAGQAAVGYGLGAGAGAVASRGSAVGSGGLPRARGGLLEGASPLQRLVQEIEEDLRVAEELPRPQPRPSPAPRLATQPPRAAAAPQQEQEPELMLQLGQPQLLLPVELRRRSWDGGPLLPVAALPVLAGSGSGGPGALGGALGPGRTGGAGGDGCLGAPAATSGFSRGPLPPVPALPVLAGSGSGGPGALGGAPGPGWSGGPGGDGCLGAPAAASRPSRGADQDADQEQTLPSADQEQTLPSGPVTELLPDKVHQGDHEQVRERSFSSGLSVAYLAAYTLQEQARRGSQKEGHERRLGSGLNVALLAAETLQDGCERNLRSGLSAARLAVETLQELAHRGEVAPAVVPCTERKAEASKETPQPSGLELSERLEPDESAEASRETPQPSGLERSELVEPDKAAEASLADPLEKIRRRVLAARSAAAAAAAAGPATLREASWSRGRLCPAATSSSPYQGQKPEAPPKRPVGVRGHDSLPVGQSRSRPDPDRRAPGWAAWGPTIRSSRSAGGTAGRSAPNTARGGGPRESGGPGSWTGGSQEACQGIYLGRLGSSEASSSPGDRRASSSTEAPRSEPPSLGSSETASLMSSDWQAAASSQSKT